MPRRINSKTNSSKIKKQFNLSVEHAEYLKNIKENHHLTYDIEALELILDEHKKFILADNIAETVVKKLEEKYNNLFTRLRLGVRTADLNSQILMEMMNSICSCEQLESLSYTPSDILPSPILSDATSYIKTKIANYKQKADSKKSKKRR